MRRLLNVPVWLLFFVLEFLCIGILFCGRELLEGLGYNVALSSQHGDQALIACILIGSCVMQRQTAAPKLLTSATFQVVCGIMAMCIGLAARLVVLSGPYWEIMDIYHNLVIVPLLVWLLAAALPTIYLQGSKTERIAAIFFLLLWAALMVYDAKTERLEQRAWLKAHHVTW